MSHTFENPGDLKCPFKATLMTRTFGCQHGSEITRREGPDIGCDSSQMNSLCIHCFDQLKSRALPEMGYTDDLTSMPASALQKIQYGGLLALQACVDGEGASENVENIAALMEKAVGKYESVDHFPFDQCIATIASYKLKRRRR